MLLIARGHTVRTAVAVAPVVGTVLSALNEGRDLAVGRVGLSTWLRLVGNYVVPFLVTSIGILAVAHQLPVFHKAKAHVLALGLYGAFDQGTRLRELAAFGRSAAGSAFSNPASTWGLASATLSGAYDPKGFPDDYFLLDSAGRIAHEGSVPVSTMGSLLDHPRSLTGVAPSAGSNVPTPAPPATLV